MPATLTVPAGVNSRVTFVTTFAVTTTQTVVISATYNGLTRTAQLTVTPPPVVPDPTLDSVFLDPAIVQTGTTSTSATIFFSGPTPPGGALVTLASSDTSKATVPASILVPGSSGAGAFPVAINGSASGTVTISATYNGVTRSAVLTISATTLFRIITQSPLPNARVGEDYAGFIEACCGQGTPVPVVADQWHRAGGTAIRRRRSAPHPHHRRHGRRDTGRDDHVHGAGPRRRREHRHEDVHPHRRPGRARW